MNKNEIKELIQKSVWGERRIFYKFPIKFSVKEYIDCSVYNPAWDFVYENVRSPIRRKINDISEYE